MKIAPGPDLEHRPCCGLNWRLLRIALSLPPSNSSPDVLLFLKYALDPLFPELGLSSSSQING